MTSFLARNERFDRVGSTNDVVRDWLAGGTPEVCLAVTDEQTAGRGRQGRTWTSAPGAGLLLSLGFRPTWLEPDQTWRLPSTVSLAMARAAELVAGLPDGAIRLKWPNDLVIETQASSAATGTRDGGGARKLAGVLGETQGLGSVDPWAVVGMGINTDWRGRRVPTGAGGVDDVAAPRVGRSTDRSNDPAAGVPRAS